MKIDKKSLILSAITVLICVLIIVPIVKAGTLTPPGAPAPTMYGLNDIYNLIVNNATTTAGHNSLSPSAAPSSTMFTLTQIYNALTNLISPSKVLTGTTYLGVAGSAAAPPQWQDETTCNSNSTCPNLCWSSTDPTGSEAAASQPYYEANNGCYGGNGFWDPTGLWNVSNWAPTTSYTVGNMVQDPDDGSYWLCAVNNTSGSGSMSDDRTAHPSWWVSISTPFSGEWAKSTPYIVGNVVVDASNSTYWYCAHAYTSGSGTFPADRTAHPTYWTQIYPMGAYEYCEYLNEDASTGFNCTGTPLTCTPVNYWHLPNEAQLMDGLTDAFIPGGTVYTEYSGNGSPGGFQPGPLYWSSSEGGYGNAWHANYSHGYVSGNGYKGYTSQVLCAH